MDLLSSINQGKASFASAMTWLFSSAIRQSCGFASSRRLLLYGLYQSALNRNRVAFLVTTEAEAITALERSRPGLLVVTPRLEGGDGLRLLQRARAIVPDIRTILLCDQDVDDLAAAAASTADAVLCEQDFFGETQPLRTMVIALTTRRRYRSPMVEAALRQAEPDMTPHTEAAGEHGMPPAITGREQDLIDLWVKGFGDREASERLGISYATVRSYGRSLRKKLGVVSRAQAVLKVINLGLSRASGH